MPLKWEDYKREFDYDGVLHDIVVLNVSIADWQSIFDFLRSSDYEHSYYIYGEEFPLPLHAKDAFPEDNNPLMVVKVGSVDLACYFFSEAEIEFSLHPEHVKNEAQAECLFDFMRQLAHLLNKEAIMVEENNVDSPIFRFLPSDEQIQYIPNSI